MSNQQVNSVPKKNIPRSMEDLTKELLAKEDVAPEIKKRDLQTGIYHITKSHPFMGGILQCMNIAYSHMLPTAGVAFNNEIKRWDLLINPHFFCNDLTAEGRIAVLLHELYHITHQHPIRVPFMKLSPHKRQLMNVAMDLAINQFIKDLPKEGCHLKDFYDEDDKGNKKVWAENKTAEYYYEKLLQRFDDPEDGEGEGECEACEGTGQEKDGNGNPTGKPCDKCNGTGKSKGNAGGGASTQDLPETIDVHNWDGSATEKDMLEATEDLVKRAMIKQCFGYDDLPGHIKELLQDIKGRVAELNYKALLLHAMKASLPANTRKHSWTRPSRRFGNKAPGTKNGESPKLEIFIDTSGSISIEEANEFLEIVDEFLKVGARECTLNMFHTENYYCEKYKLGRKIKREEFQSGGTCLKDSFKNIAKKRPDLSVFLTDGYYDKVDATEFVGPNNKFPKVLFIISKNGQEKHPMKDEDYARTVKIPNAERSRE